MNSDNKVTLSGNNKDDITSRNQQIESSMNSTFPQQQLGKMIGTIAIIALSLTGVIWLQKSLIAPETKQLTPEEYEKQQALEKLQLNVYKNLPSFGYGNIAADWFYLRFIQYFGERASSEPG